MLSKLQKSPKSSSSSSPSHYHPLSPRAFVKPNKINPTDSEEHSTKSPEPERSTSDNNDPRSPSFQNEPSTSRLKTIPLEPGKREKILKKHHLRRISKEPRPASPITVKPRRIRRRSHVSTQQSIKFFKSCSPRSHDEPIPDACAQRRMLFHQRQNRFSSRHVAELQDIRETCREQSVDVGVSSEIDGIRGSPDGLSLFEISPLRDSATMSERQNATQEPQWTLVQRFCGANMNIWDWIATKAKKVFFCYSSESDTTSYGIDTIQDDQSTLDREVTDYTEREMVSYLDQNKGFLHQYIMDNVPLRVMERLYVSKIELEMNKSREDQRDALQKCLRFEHDFMSLLKALKKDPSEHEIILELAASIRMALGGEAFRAYKINPEDHQELVEVFTVDDTGVLPEPLVLKPREPNIQVLETIRRKSCIYFTRYFDPVRLERKSRSLFKANYRDTHELPHELLVPILADNGEVSYVIEIWRSVGFRMAECDVAAFYTAWGSLSRHFCNIMLDKKKECEMTDFLLETVKAIFEEIVSLDQVIKRILHFAQSLVDADRASLFMVDDKTQELVSSVFDLKLYGQDSPEQFRIPISRGIAGHVALTGKSVNITNAYEDERFNREVDELTGYRTTSILCMPVKVMGRAIGVVQMVNKQNAPKFGCEDERSFKQFATFFGVALHHAELYGQITRKEQKYRVAIEVLSYHNTCRDSEVAELVSLEPHHLSFPLEDFYLDPFELTTLEKCQAAILMFDDLFNLKNFDSKCLSRFILSVRKNYRSVPYHNFNHGWSVAQTMYSILKNDTSEHFSPMQRLALFIASLCHDLDHRGYTNKYMSETASPLAAMYTTSTLEHHHFNITVTILQQDGHNIFGHFSSEEYKEVLSLIKTCILATDLASFFPKLAELQELCKTDQPLFNWNNMQHSELAMAISMTAADLSASAKPWNVQNETVKVIFKEFYDQGDKERAAGREPIPMMDRNKPEEQPASQVGFITQICLPCYNILQKLLPETNKLLIMALQNRDMWVKKAAEVEKQRAMKQVEDDVANIKASSSDLNKPELSGLENKDISAANFILTQHNKNNDENPPIIAIDDDDSLAQTN